MANPNETRKNSQKLPAGPKEISFNLMLSLGLPRVICPPPRASKRETGKGPKSSTSKEVKGGFPWEDRLCSRERPLQRVQEPPGPPQSATMPTQLPCFQSS